MVKSTMTFSNCVEAVGKLLWILQLVLDYLSQTFAFYMVAEGGSNSTYEDTHSVFNSHMSAIIDSL